MEAEIQAKIKNLKKTETVIKQGVGEDVSLEEEERTREQFFDTGAQYWCDLLGDLTFPTIFIPILKEEALEIVRANIVYKETGEVVNIADSKEGKFLNGLLQRIKDVLDEKKWQKYFIKLSTRSPKDSPLILKKAILQFKTTHDEWKSQSLENKIIKFTSCVQNNFGVQDHIEGLNLLISSDRIKEDLEFALQSKEDFSKYKIQIVLREWKETIPIHREFRAFVWKRNLNAIGQYYHTFFFPHLSEESEEIKLAIKDIYLKRVESILPKNLENFMIDFAVLSDKSLKVIEVNPFDGKHLGSFPGSTGLFLLDNILDRQIIENGPLEIRIRKEPLSEKEIKEILNPNWRKLLKGIIF